MFLTIFLLGIAEGILHFFYRTANLSDNLVSSTAKDGFFFLNSDIEPRFLARTAPKSSVVFPKSNNTIRIVVLGESAAFGTPFLPELSFPHFLQIELSRQWPELRFEVINLAFFAQTSEFAHQAAKDLIAAKPDYILYYGGHNELYPWNLYWRIKDGMLPRNLARRFSDFLLNKSIGFSMLAHFIQKEAPSPARVKKFGNLHFDSASHIEEATQYFTESLVSIANLAKSVGAEFILINPLKNISNFSPDPRVEFEDPVKPNEVKRLLNLSSLSANDQFRLGHFYLAKKNNAKAKFHFLESSDHNFRVGRINSRLTRAMEQIAHQDSRTTYYDLEKEWNSRDRSEFTLPKYFTDWIHLTLNTQLQIAHALTLKLSSSLKSHHEKSGIEESLEMSELPKSIPNFRTLQAIGLQESGYFNFQMGHYPRAIHDFKESLALKWESKSALGLWVCYHRLGEKTKIKVLLQKLQMVPRVKLTHDIHEFYSSDERLLLETFTKSKKNSFIIREKIIQPSRRVLSFPFPKARFFSKLGICKIFKLCLAA